MSKQTLLAGLTIFTAHVTLNYFTKCMFYGRLRLDWHVLIAQSFQSTHDQNPEKYSRFVDWQIGNVSGTSSGMGCGRRPSGTWWCVWLCSPSSWLETGTGRNLSRPNCGPLAECVVYTKVRHRSSFMSSVSFLSRWEMNDAVALSCSRSPYSFCSHGGGHLASPAASDHFVAGFCEALISGTHIWALYISYKHWHD